MNNKYLLLVPLILGLVFVKNIAFGQNCPCTVNAGPDKNLCEPGGSVQLNGIVTGQPISVEWSPENGLSNPNSVSPIATVDQTTTFTLTTKCVNNTNLVNNANFNAGNTGFTSDYTYSATNLLPEGIYTVTNNPQSVHPGFAPCGDHTGGGQMMVINGAGTPNQDVWCQTIPVIPNTEYAFETWVASVVSAAPALLQFSINGQTIGPVFEAPGTNCQWEKFVSTWNSGPSTFATICIVNQNTVLGGNDFALDDISFKEVCTISDKVTVFVHPVKQTYQQASICQGQTYTIAGQTFQNEGSYDITLKTWKGCDSIVTLDLAVIEVEAEIDPPYKLDCGLTEIFLYGDNSSFGSEYSYKWTTTNGSIVSDPTQNTVIVNKPGKYTLTVTYNDGTIICSQSTFVIVETDYTKPVISAGNNGLLTCADSTLLLNGTVISPSDNFSVKWSTTNGKIISKTDTLNPLIGSPGLYILTVTSFYTGCTQSDTVFIDKDPSLPTAAIDGKNKLDCYSNSLWLNGFSSDNGPGFDFKWSTSTGQFNSNIDSLAVNINLPGTYTLTITNKSTGCKSNTSFNVSGDFNPPLSDAGPTDTLSCALTSLKLNGTTNLPDSLIKVNWSTLNGNIISGSDSLASTIGLPGIYIVSVMNILNGCSATDSVLVVKDENAPSIIDLMDQTITCKTASFLIDAAGSSIGSQFIYIWTTPDGNIVGPNDQQTALLDQKGLYMLTIVNQNNGCSIADTLQIFQDKNYPIADAGAIDLITCKKTTVTLNANQSSTGPEFTYVWTTPVSGNIISGSNGLSPVVDKPGLYLLEVSNTINGCQSKDSVQISIDTIAPIVIVPTDLTITCQQPEININAKNITATGSFNYSWNTLSGNIISGQQSLNPLVNKSGTYTLITTNQSNGCTDTDIVTVISNEDLPIIDAGLDLVLTCASPSKIALSTLIYLGGNIDINWSSNNQPVLNGSNTLTPQIGFPGIYTITVKDTITGCSASDMILVSLDTITPKTTLSIPPVINCKNLQSEITLQTTDINWSYIWTTAVGNIIGMNSNSIIKVDKAGPYFLTVTDNMNGCSKMYVGIVFEDINSPIISAGPDKEITCTKKIVGLEGSIQGSVANKTINWTLNGQTLTNGNWLTPQVEIIGSYLLTVVDQSNGCSTTDEVFVTENTNKPTDFVAEIVPPGCTKSGTVSVIAITGGVGPYFYSINGGNFQNQSIFQSIISGNYLISIKDQNGCEFQKSLVVPEPPDLTAELPQLITIEYGAQKQLFPELNIPEKNIDKVNWKPVTGLSCSDCLNPIASPLNEIYYTVTVTDITGCTASAKVQIRVLKDFGLYIPNAFSPNADGNNDKWQLFGNPLKVVKIKRLQIFDRWGEAMYEAYDFQVNDPDFGWNGKHHEKYLNPAVFVYFFEAEFIDGSTRLYKGDINLIK